MPHIIRPGYYEAADTILSASWSEHVRGLFELQRGPSAGEQRIEALRAADVKSAKATDLKVEDSDPRAFLRAMREGR